MIKLSIVIPFYEAEPYTSELISVLARQISEEVEIIVIDDGSRQPFETKYDCIKVIRKENGGVSTARNLGLDVSAGEYVQFIDADDMVPDYFVKKLLAKIDSSRADVIDFSWRSLDHTGIWADVQLIEDKTFLTNPSACTRCFRKSFIGDVRFNETKDATEDEDFSRRLGYLFDDTPMKKVSMAAYMYYYRTGVPGSKSKKYQKGLKKTKRVIYYFDHVTPDMTYLIDEIRKENEVNEVRLLTNECDIPELKRYCCIMKPRKMWTHYLRGENNKDIMIEPIPKHFDVVLYCNKLNKVGGITSFLLYWCSYFKDEYKIALMCDKMDDSIAARFRQQVEVLGVNSKQPISCDTIILNRFNDVIPGNVTYNKSIQVCHACRVDGFHISRNRDYVVNVSEYAKASWGQEAAGAKVIRNMVAKSEDKTLVLMSATRIGAPDKGDNDKRFRILADKLNRAKIPFIWFNFSDKPLSNPPRNFINMEPRSDMQALMRIASYVVQLSSEEACSMTVQEALVNHVPIICTPVPSFEEQGVIDGHNAHVVPFNMDFDISILLDIPEYGYIQDVDAIKDKWRKLLAADPVPHARYLIKVTRKFKDMELKREVFPGTTYEVSRERAAFLCKELKVAEIVD